MKDLWNIDTTENRGIYLHFAKRVDIELKKEIQTFCRWVRSNYVFPIRLNVYISDAPYILNSQSKEQVSATIFLPDDYSSPLIRVSTGSYLEDIKKSGLFSADCSVLASIAHEITHYFQWLKYGNVGLSEEQARRKAKQIVYKYVDLNW